MLSFVAIAAWAPTPRAPVVQTECGPVSGALNSEQLAVFKSVMSKSQIAHSMPQSSLVTRNMAERVSSRAQIPYASVPRRWAHPKDRPSAGKCWAGTFDASAYEAQCNTLFTPGQGDEDCLSLSVWTTANASAASAPVFVFFHGGDLTTGEAKTDWSLMAADGRVWASRAQLEDGKRVALRLEFYIVQEAYKILPTGTTTDPCTQAGRKIKMRSLGLTWMLGGRTQDS